LYIDIIIHVILCNIFYVDKIIENSKNNEFVLYIYFVLLKFFKIKIMSNLYMYVHIHKTHIYAYICIYVCMYVYICIYIICMHIGIYMCVYTYVHIHIYICISHIYAYRYICMYVCVYVRVYIYILYWFKAYNVHVMLTE